MPLPRILKNFLLQSLFWTGLCLATELVCAYILRLPYPYNYPATPASDIFPDFRNYVFKFKYFHSTAFFQSPLLTYPAPTVALFRVFIPAGTERALGVTLGFLGFILLSVACLAFFFYRSLLGRRTTKAAASCFVLSTVCLSFPIWFEVHQANIEVIVWLVVSLGLWAFWTEKFWLASACFGLAASMKIFPAVLLGLPLARRQYPQLALAVLIAGMSTVAGLWLVCPNLGYSWHATMTAVTSLMKGYALSFQSLHMGFDHGLYALVRFLIPHYIAPAAMQHVLQIYLVLAAVTGVGLYVLRIQRLTPASQIASLSIASILFPPVSIDYTLMHLYAPFALFTYAALKKPVAAGSVKLAFFLFAFLLSAQSEFIGVVSALQVS